MKAEVFALILLQNLWRSRTKQKISFMGLMMICAIGQGISRRCDIIDECSINSSSFYSAVKRMIVLGWVRKISNAPSRQSRYELTNEGTHLYQQIFTSRKEAA